MFRFADPSAFYWLWLIPIVIAVALIFARQSRSRLTKILGDRVTPFLTGSVSPKKRAWKLGLQLAALACFVTALARPQMGKSKEEIHSEGVELMMLLDVSESMLAEDVKPNRLEQMKAEMEKLVDLMPENKMGVVAFAGSAALLSPLTTDPNALKMYLDSLSTTSVSTQGTNFEKALEEAEAAFQHGGVTTDDTDKVTRVILIASDGEDQEPGALDEAKKLAAKGIRIFTLAYGTEKGAPIPERDGMGFLRGYKKDRGGQTILTTSNGKALRELAQAGQGSFYYAVFGGNYLQKIVEDVNHLQKAQFESEFAVQYEERFQIFVALGLVLLLIEMLLGERHSAFRLWRGRFEVPPR
jgi:Ca-activated chloride channel family protein